jgi:hypothetical protein
MVETIEEELNRAPYKKKPSQGLTIASDIGSSKPAQVRKQHFNERGERIDPYDVDKFQAFKAQQEIGYIEAKPVSDLINLYDTWSYWKAQAISAASKADYFMNQIIAYENNKDASPEVKKAGRKKRLEIEDISNYSKEILLSQPAIRATWQRALERYMANMVESRSMVESLFFIKEEIPADNNNNDE